MAVILKAMPFGPSLAIGVMITLLGWPYIGRPYEPLFFDPLLLGLLVGLGAVLLLITSFMLRVLRGSPE